MPRRLAASAWVQSVSYTHLDVYKRQAHKEDKTAPYPGIPALLDALKAEGAPSMYRSLHEHKYQTLKAASTFADGIQVKTPGELT